MGKCMVLEGAQPQIKRQALREVHVLRQLAHPNVLRIRDAFLHRNHFVLVSDFCDAGDLQALIAKRRQRGKLAEEIAVPNRDGAFGFSEAAVLGVFAQVTHALKYIHDHRIVHRDLKTSNIMLTKKGVVKVGDFGVAVVASSTLLPNSTEAAPGDRFVGNINHLPPEVCDGGEQTAAGDCWALGVVLYEMCALELPFNGSNMLAVVLQILDGLPKPLPATYSSQLCSLCRGLLCTDIARRLTASQALATPLVLSVLRNPGFADDEPSVPACREEALRLLSATPRPFALRLGAAEKERFMMRQFEAMDSGES